MKHKHNHRLIAFCWASGQIDFGTTLPEGAIPVASGRPDSLRRVIAGMARIAYRNHTLLVPGIPEAIDGDSAIAALEQFSMRVRSRLSKLQEAA